LVYAAAAQRHSVTPPPKAPARLLVIAIRAQSRRQPLAQLSALSTKHVGGLARQSSNAGFAPAISPQFSHKNYVVP
jgi:hypothetical protein